MHYFDASTGAGKRKVKKLCLALRLLLCLRRLVLTTCAVLGALMLTFVLVSLVKLGFYASTHASLRFKSLVLLVVLALLIAWPVKLGLKTCVSSVYVKKKKLL